MKSNYLLFAALVLQFYLSIECTKLVCFSFGNENGDSIQRQIESAKIQNIDLKLIPIETTISKSNKLSLMKDYIEPMKHENETIILIVEKGSIFLNNSDEIKSRFQSMNTRLLISADHSCYPDAKLIEMYPNVNENQKRFVNVDGLIGFADTLYEALLEESLNNIDDSQYYFTKLFINKDLQTKFNVKLDSKSEIFQNIDQSVDDIKIYHSLTGEGSIYNNATGSFPAIVQPRENTIYINTLSNYLGKAWDPIIGCQQCRKNNVNLEGKNINDYPNVTVAIFIDQPTPFIAEFFNRVSNLSYPKSKINLRISNIVESHESLVKTFINNFQSAYKSLAYSSSSEQKTIIDRRSEAIKECSISDCDYLLIIDSVVQITDINAIQTLITYNKPIIAPLLSRREKSWSNFWGDINIDNYYARSFDYLDIINGERKGIWNVPHIQNMYLIKKDLVQTLHDVYTPLRKYGASEYEMIFSGNMRKRDQFMFVVNEDVLGYLVDAETTQTDHLHNDLWEIFANPLDWEEKYIHKNYSAIAHEETTLDKLAQPCPDVFWWPFVSETFSKHMIEEMEHFGKWSNGKNEDSRLEGGYENVPTRDIHMRQVNWEQHWMEVLRKYVYPMQTKLFKGYYDEPKARMNFVVRYKPTEQDRLRPHHDASSYTLNLALNKPGIDYEGGGARFPRYNCSVTDSKVGWVLMHPGRITHIHEGLPTTKGTRYIFVTFVNP